LKKETSNYVIVMNLICRIKMKKLIDIPDEIIKDLKKLAIDQDKDLKNFIQDELKKLVQNSQSKPS